MNREKAREVLREFDEVNGYYSEKFKEHEPEVNELKEMQYDFTELSVKLNKTLDEPEVIRENQRSVIDGLMRKSDYKYDEKRLEDPRLIQPYSAQPVQKAWYKSGKGLLFSGLAGLLLGASGVGHAVQAHNNYELERVLRVAEPKYTASKELSVEEAKIKYCSDKAAELYFNFKENLVYSALSDIGHKERREGNYNCSTYSRDGNDVQGSLTEIRDYISGKIKYSGFSRSNNPLELIQQNKDVRDAVAELVLKDLANKNLAEYSNVILEDLGNNKYIMQYSEAKNAR